MGFLYGTSAFGNMATSGKKSQKRLERKVIHKLRQKKYSKLFGKKK